MNNVLPRFRIVTWLMALLLAWFAIATIFAETLAPKPLPFSEYLAIQDASPNNGIADLAVRAAPLRGDLIGDIALARAVASLKPDKASPERTVSREHALAIALQSLSFSPHSSSMWLLVSMLQNQGPKQDFVAEALKMSYLTGPADWNLIPARIAIVSAAPVISDAELKGLARGDIRLILTRRPDLKVAIINAYRRGSAEGKAYIDEAVRSLDPGFAASLR
jgi:hypothetical protein